MNSDGDQKRIIRKSDRVTIFLKGKKFTATVVEGRMSLGNFSISGNELIGATYGTCEIAGMKLTVLPSIARDHMETMKRGPQVILPDDASTILLYAGITPGTTVLEAGSGSGGLTIALASAVGNMGKIVSMDIKSANSLIAQKNIKKAGLQHQVEFVIGDVKNGEFVRKTLDRFDIPEVDVVMLDMPDPWEALDTIGSMLKIGGVLVCYLPTMNQVEKIRGELEGWGEGWKGSDRDSGGEGGFIDVSTHESLNREIVVRKGAVRPDYTMLGHTGYLTFARRYQ